MNERSSLNQSPEFRLPPMSDCIACMRTFCAASSEWGAIHSPMAKVATTKARPIFASTRPASSGERPAARITVYSELLDRCAST